MTIHHKAGLALAVFAALGQAHAANAFAGVDVTPTVTGSAGAFTYSYDVSPTDFNASQLGFTFSDSNVTFDSVSGPLDTVIGTPAGSGSFVNYSAKGGTLKAGDTETIVFSSPDAPNGTLGVSGTGIATADGIGFKKGQAVGGGGASIGPSPVPEASTTVSLGLMLALGLGGVVVAARKKKLTA